MHYWQNHQNGVSEHFQPFAKEYLRTEILSMAEEPEDLYIPLEFDVHFPLPKTRNSNFRIYFAGNACF